MDRAKAEELIEQYVDGTLPLALAGEFERCMAGDQSLREAVEDATVIRSELPMLREESPGEGYWRRFAGQRLAGELVRLERRPALRWKTRLAFGGALACIAVLVVVSLSYRTRLHRLQKATARAAEDAAPAGLTGYFETSQKTGNDRAVFDSLEATYPQRVQWAGRSNGHAFVGLSNTPVPAARTERKLLAIESVILRTTAGGKREVLLRPRIVAWDGAETAIEIPATATSTASPPATTGQRRDRLAAGAGAAVCSAAGASNRTRKTCTGSGMFLTCCSPRSSKAKSTLPLICV